VDCFGATAAGNAASCIPMNRAPYPTFDLVVFFLGSFVSFES
jgi:hypothetical protein